jgi:translation elongation factor EF-1alpha
MYKTNSIQDHCYEQSDKYDTWSKTLDIYDEERMRSKTHEFSIIDIKYENEEYQMIDTPGHKGFIRSLIEGISVYPGMIGCIIISSRNGEFEAGWVDGQTKEDIILTKSVGIDHAIILINKMDLVEWSKNNYEKIVKIVTPFINGCKFKSVYYMPVSGYTGIGLINTIGYPDWYKEPCFMDIIKSIKVEMVENVEKEIQVKEWKTFTTNIRVLQINGLITSEYTCILHYGGKEYNIMIEKIKGKKNVIMDL